MLRLQFVISLLKLIQSTSMRGGFLGLGYPNFNTESKSRFFFSVLELNFGTQFPTNFVNSPKDLLKKHFHDSLLLIMETEDDYVEAPILLQKIAKSAATT